MVACMLHEACHKGATIPEVPMSPQPDLEPTRVTWMFEGKRICFRTVVNILKTGHHTVRITTGQR